MVEQVKAYQSSDGKLFTSEWEALQQDAIVSLSATFDKEEMRSVILNNRETIFEALRPLVQHEMRNKSK